MRRSASIITVLAIAGSARAEQVIWRLVDARTFGAASHVEGSPRRVSGPAGTALQFNGDDSLLVDTRPLVGAATFTIEAIVRPEGGPNQQRFMHMAETDSATGTDALPTGTSDPNSRFMFEVRVVEGGWYLDAYTRSKAGQATLVDPTKLHPLNRWYAVAQTYDGTTYRAYVDGQLQAEAKLAFTPLGSGRVRVGARMNRIDYFTGSIAIARFTDRALDPADLLITSARDLEAK